MVQHSSVMIIGKGAREHVLSYAYEKSEQIDKIIIVPGNDFMKYGRQKETIIDKNCSLKNPESILKLARKYKPDLVDVAQDDAIAHGTVDLLQRNGFQTFGPTKNAARIEWDKKWSREFMWRFGIPQPAFKYFDGEGLAEKYVKEIYQENPVCLVYVKATGLCSGKGALKSTCLEQAMQNINQMKNIPEGAGKVFLIEEGLVGEEFSYYAVSDGNTYFIFNSAQDNKTIFNFDEGDQTGGMGAISPAMITKPFADQIDKEMILRMIEGMDLEGNQYRGVLYLGGIIVDGKPINIEYNARWGDPECQVVLPAVKTDYFEIVSSCLNGRLDEVRISQDNKTRVCVVGASRGYPESYSQVKGKRIYGLEEVMREGGVTIFGAGVEVQDGKFYANGGRLFSVVAEGEDILEARQRAYSSIARISVEGNNLHYRTDIGWRDVERFFERN